MNHLNVHMKIINDKFWLNGLAHRLVSQMVNKFYLIKALLWMLGVMTLGITMQIPW